jgi:hypothetical protein
MHLSDDCSYHEAKHSMALGESRPHTGEDFVLLRRALPPHLCSPVLDGTRVRASSLLADFMLITARWVHISYTLQALYLLPMRIYKYKKRAWHYFLFDLCYYVTILNFLFIWAFPSNAALFVACYCLSHGSLASAVITWRNSLVFHDSDKVTSLFIHIYPPFAFTTIR